MLKKLGILTLGSVWSFLVFLFTAPLFFPTSELESWAEYQVQEGTRGATLIDLSDLSFLGMAGVSGKLDVYKGTKQRRRKRRRNKATATPPVHQLSIEHFTVRPHIISAVMGRAMADFSVEVGGAELEGAGGVSSDAFYLDMDTEDFDLAKVPGFDSDEFSVDFTGKLNLESDLVFSRTDPKESTGELSLTVDQLQLINGKLKSMGFDLMPTTFSESVLKFNVEDGRATVTEGRFLGDLVEAEIEGDIILNKKLSRSRLSLRIKAKILDSAMDTVLKTMSKTKRARDDEGYYHFRGSGTVSKPRFTPERKGSRAGGLDDVGSESKPNFRSNRRGGDSDDDAATRRKKRRERIKKRRERMKERRRKRREREAQQTDDFAGEDNFREEEDRGGNIRRNRRRLDQDDGFEQVPQDMDYPQDVIDLPPENIEPEYDDEPPEDDQEDLEDLGYINE